MYRMDQKLRNTKVAIVSFCRKYRYYFQYDPIEINIDIVYRYFRFARFLTHPVELLKKMQ